MYHLQQHLEQGIVCMGIVSEQKSGNVAYLIFEDGGSNYRRS